MKIHEYQAKAILAKYDVPVPRGEVAYTVEEAEAAAKKIGGSVVVKAQIHAGGRGKGGGVKIAQNAAEAAEIAKRMLGMTLVTHQTGPEGRVALPRQNARPIHGGGISSRENQVSAPTRTHNELPANRAKVVSHDRSNTSIRRMSPSYGKFSRRFYGSRGPATTRLTCKTGEHTRDLGNAKGNISLLF